MSAWLWLALAILVEVVATSALKASDGLSRPGLVLIVVAGYVLAFYCLAMTLRTIPVGVAYAIWSGAGTVLISVIGWHFFAQKLDGPAIAGVALIVVGVVLLNLSGSR